MHRLIAFVFILAPALVHAADLTGTIENPQLRRKTDLVYVEKVDGKYPLTPATMNQKGNTYLPHILPVLQGTSIKFQSEDPELHNVYATAKMHVIFNNAVVPHSSFDRKFDALGIIHLGCNVHKEMSAWVLVLQNPYFAKPAKTGEFTIKDLPAGTYTVRIWGEALSEEQNQMKFTYTVGGQPLKIAGN